MLKIIRNNTRYISFPSSNRSHMLSYVHKVSQMAGFDIWHLLVKLSFCDDRFVTKLVFLAPGWPLRIANSKWKCGKASHRRKATCYYSSSYVYYEQCWPHHVKWIAINKVRIHLNRGYNRTSCADMFASLKWKVVFFLSLHIPRQPLPLFTSNAFPCVSNRIRWQQTCDKMVVNCCTSDLF